MKIANWGLYPVREAALHRPRQEQLNRLLDEHNLIARGMGRSYGDASLAPHILSTLPWDRLLAFDEARGILQCEAGVRFDTLIDVFLPRGWFLPVTPGTKFITVGGALAADIHGKNHHVAGSFADHVVSVDLLLPDGEIAHCNHEENADLFHATAGGMGLTGFILCVRFRLQRVPSAFIARQTLRARNLGELTALCEAHCDATYSVAWLDCLQRGKQLGRGALFLGEHAANLPKRLAPAPYRLPKKRPKTVPFFLPSLVLNRYSVKLFNSAYYAAKPSKPRQDLVDLDTFFYPLDSIHHWNRIYGRRGFVQYQCVLPASTGKAALHSLLDRIAATGSGSFLAVLKLFGPGREWLSFPMAGYTLALDFPATARVFRLLDELDRDVVAAGGRLYLAKDARMQPDTLRAGYPDLTRFLELKQRIDPHNRLASDLSRRLEMTPCPAC